MKDYKHSGYALSSAGLLEELEQDIRQENPTWDDDKVAKEMDKVLKKATLYNQYNKKPKKSKEADDYIKEKKVK